MKTIALLISVSLFPLFTDAQPLHPIFRGPPITSLLHSNIIAWDAIAQNQAHPQHVILQEASDTLDTVIASGAKIYFAVYVPNLPNRGTVLELDSPQVNFHGVVGLGITFNDVLNHTNYYVPFIQNTNSGTIGSFVTAGETIWVSIFDKTGTGYFPEICLTWGDGSAPNNPGTILDDFSSAIVETNPPPIITTLTIVNTLSNAGDPPQGICVEVTTFDEHYTLQSSTSLTAWIDEPVPLEIFGYVGFHYYTPGQTIGNKFFRAKR